MDNIPTAENFLQDHLQISHFYDDKAENMVCYSDDVQKAMVEFAKLHVEQALKVKGKAMQEMSNEDSSFSIDELDAFTKNCYPLSNIK